MIYYFTKMNEFDKSDFFRSYRLLSHERKEKVDQYRFLCQKKMSALAYLLLKFGIKREYSIEEELKFEYGKYGKPVLKNHYDIKFNLSHCKWGVACAISDKEVGIDIEYINYENLECINMVMSKEEKYKILQSKNPEVVFTRFWTIKESYLKNLGIGLIDTLNEINFSKWMGNQFQYNGVKFQIINLENMFLSICSSCNLQLLEIDKMQLFNTLTKNKWI